MSGKPDRGMDINLGRDAMLWQPSGSGRAQEREGSVLGGTGGKCSGTASERWSPLG